jgi:GTPase Era involved in 16S rRNA processing
MFVRMQEATTPLDRKMMNNVQQAVREADAIVVVVDGSFRPKEALAAFQPGPNWSGPPVSVVRLL